MQLKDTETPCNTCMSVCVYLRVCLYVGGRCVSTDVAFLTRTPLLTSGVGWCTRTLQTQTDRSSWPHHYKEQKTNLILRSINPLKTINSNDMKKKRWQLTRHQEWVEWVRWWTGHQSCPVQIPLRCWAWTVGPPVSAPAEITEQSLWTFLIHWTTLCIIKSVVSDSGKRILRGGTFCRISRLNLSNYFDEWSLILVTFRPIYSAYSLSKLMICHVLFSYCNNLWLI